MTRFLDLLSRTRSEIAFHLRFAVPLAEQHWGRPVGFLFGIFAAWILLLLSSPTARAAETPPNVLVIIADDLNLSLGCYGADHMHSPNLDRLASEGVLFRRAYCQTALCGPSRNSFFSGARPDSTQVYNNRATFREALPDVASLPQHFKSHGYFTRGFGKVLHDGQDDPASWSEPFYFPEERVYARPENRNKVPIIDRADVANRANPLFETADVEDEAYWDGLTTGEALATLSRVATEDKPFFLMLGYHKPHTPFNAPADYWDLYDRGRIPLAANPFPPANVPEKYAMSDFRYVRSFQGVPESGPFPDAYAREVRHAYFACVSFIDAQVGKLLAALENSGTRENTIVVFFSDHGYQLGEHAMWCKHTNFETSTQVPLIVSAPGKAFARGASCEALAELVDLYPTLADLCGLPLPDHLEGNSLAPLLRNPVLAWPDLALSQFQRAGARGYSIRTPEFRYTEWRDLKTGGLSATELYDHRTDPMENENVAGEAAYAAKIPELSKLLAAKRKALTLH